MLSLVCFLIIYCAFRSQFNVLFSADVWSSHYVNDEHTIRGIPVHHLSNLHFQSLRAIIKQHLLQMNPLNRCNVICQRKYNLFVHKYVPKEQ